MLIAEKLRKENIAEFLLYMWQLEDLIRAFQLSIDEIKSNYIQHFNDWTNQQKDEAAKWYEDIINMMRGEGISVKGHLQICNNVIINLTDLHQSLLGSQKYPYYHAAYSEALPLIVEFRARQNSTGSHPELESCFELLYGVMILKMKQQPVSEETQQATRKVSTFLAMLTDYYHKNLIEPLEL